MMRKAALLGVVAGGVILGAWQAMSAIGNVAKPVTTAPKAASFIES